MLGPPQPAVPDLDRQLVQVLLAESDKAAGLVGFDLRVLQAYAEREGVSEMLRKASPGCFAAMPRDGDEAYPPLELLAKEGARVAEAAEKAGVSLCIVKGASVACLYPAGVARQQSDVDVAVPDLDSAWRLIAAIEPLGYQIGVLAVRRASDGDYDANIALWRRDSTFVEPLELEVWVRSQPISRSFAMALSSRIWARPSADGFPPLVDRLAFLAADVLESGDITLRDCCDFAFISAVCDRSTLGAFAADGEFFFLRRVISGLARRTLSIPELRRFCDGPAEHFAGMGGPLEACDAVSAGVAMGAALGREAAAVREFQLARGPMDPSSCGDPLAVMRGGEYVRFLPAPRLAEPGPFSAARADECVLLRTPIGIFLAEAALYCPTGTFSAAGGT
ncbi:MAG TPA: hypothetical protein VN240_02125 [Propylenella sp.]|nr:hypothetical protein [Propylenella sp.]